MRTILLVDGENFKGKIKDVYKAAGKERPVWHEYNFKGLIDQVLRGIKIDRTAFYFAKIKMHPEFRKKSSQLIEEQRLLKTHLEKQGFEVVLTGRVRGHVAGKKMVFKEKGVDVKVAVDMITTACDKKASAIVLASSDSDLQPAISEIQARGTECYYLGFEVNPNKGISYTTKRTILIRNAEVFEFATI